MFKALLPAGGRANIKNVKISDKTNTIYYPGNAYGLHNCILTSSYDSRRPYNDHAGSEGTAGDGRSFKTAA
jgi:hypothetical protein